MKPVISRQNHWGGKQDIYRFANGYGASVVLHSFSYGLELAVIKFTGSEDEHLKFKLTYETPVTDDVLGHLDDETLAKALAEIEALPAVVAA